MTARKKTDNSEAKHARARKAKAVINHQRYATFSLELLLNDDNTVRRTKLTHVQSGDSQTWAEWAASDVVAFIEAKESLPPAKAYTPVVAETMKQNDIGCNSVSVVPAAAPATAPAQSILSQSTTQISLLGVLRADDAEFNNLISSEQSYLLRLALDVNDERFSRDVPLIYEAVIRAKQLGSKRKAKIGTISGTMLAGKHMVIDMNGERLAPGMYRLDAGVMLRGGDKQGKASELSLWHEGGLISVY